MEVTRYIFQSPYSNQVQIGKPDTTTSQDKGGDMPQIIESTSKAANKASAFEDSQTKGVTPKVEGSLDIYA
ncbi:MAG: hypothetical protein PHQ93_00510 [Sulfurimonas sp.]|uniref:hypothetical protein n=1 Tax=Sulfurimonas sp. TaxID=2022749 RepID=UPI002620E140|nr:hypothetical protein [Sulfurimonas sp.]MDD5399654.1 hypothetical protein [Sulfurimonas sp.]